MTLHGSSFTGKLIEKFGPGHHRRGISDDPAFRELDILSTLGVYGSRGKGDERTSCTGESCYLYVKHNTIFSGSDTKITLNLTGHRSA